MILKINTDMERTIGTSSPPPSQSKWRSLLYRLLIALVATLVLFAGAFTAWYFFARANMNLVNTLQYIESGSIPDPPQPFLDSVKQALDEPSLNPTLPGVYTFLREQGGVTFNAVLVLGTDGLYQYALTVGNVRVHKLFKHSGRWWVQGRVFHTILVDGDRFLVPPTARDSKTPSRHLMSSIDGTALTLQSSTGEPVTYKRDASIQ